MGPLLLLHVACASLEASGTAPSALASSFGAEFGSLASPARVVASPKLDLSKETEPLVLEGLVAASKDWDVSDLLAEDGDCRIRVDAPPRGRHAVG